MRKFNVILLFSAMLTLLVLDSCDKGGDDPESERDKIVAALAGTWTIDAANSTFGTGIDDASTNATFTETTFTFTGDIVTYVSGGSYSISEEGAFGSVAVTLVPTDISLSGTPTVAINAAFDTVTVTFSVVESSGGRLEGVGSYSLIFKKQ